MASKVEQIKGHAYCQMRYTDNGIRRKCKMGLEGEGYAASQSEACFRATEQGYRPSFSTARDGAVGIVLEHSHRLGQDTSRRVPPEKQRKVAEKKR